jgi:4-amino-4-deoxy-L-arabinose transferase-like glycosyltransferase
VIDCTTNRPALSLSSTGGACSNPPLWLLYPLFFVAVCLAHWTLLRLPYYWDEGGYYIPAALDFYHTGTLIPHFTNAHPPLPNVVLGTLWHLTGFHILATRMLVCAFASAALLAVFRLARNLLGTPAAAATTLLTAVYPIWFVQSSLAHADIFAAAFTLWAFALYLESLNPLQAQAPSQISTSDPTHSFATKFFVALLFTLATLSKETAILQPATLAALELVLLLRVWRQPNLRRAHAEWLAALSFPLLPLVAWYVYHHHATGFTFGNPEYLRYNATANFTAAHIYSALHFRFLHLFWQRNIWLPLTLALACLLLPARPRAEARPLAPALLGVIALLVVTNWLAFSILGGAALTRYLLPIYPLLLLACVATWRSRLRAWPALAALTVAAFVSALWISPPYSFAPEDNLAYRDMIVVDQEAAVWLNEHYPDARVLTAWPVSTDLFCPDLGYTNRPFKIVPVQDFTPAEIARVAAHPDDFDTAVVFSTHFASPELQRYLLAHPHSRRHADFAPTQLLTPAEIARQLGGSIVWQDDRRGEWVAILRFPSTKTP